MRTRRSAVDLSGSVRIGEHVRFEEGPVRSHIHATAPGVVEIGDHVVIGFGAAIAAQSSISIGAGSALGAYVAVMDSDFHVAGAPDEQATADPVVIGDGVRIGHHVTILRGSRIGTGAVVLDGSVVSGQVAAGELVSGNPARPGGAHDAPVGPSSIAEIVADVFELGDAPAASSRPMDIPGWDSLGALRLLLEIERRTGAHVDAEMFASTPTIGDLEHLVARSAG